MVLPGAVAADRGGICGRGCGSLGLLAGQLSAGRGGGAAGRRCAALLFQPAQRRLERLADRWVFGARLDGYEVLTRFGAMLETSPRPADLRRPGSPRQYATGWACRWARVRLDLTTAGGSLPTACAAGLEPDDVREPALDRSR